MQRKNTNGFGRAADAVPILIYYSSSTLLPAKTRVFVNFVAEHFKRNPLAERFAAASADQALESRRPDAR